MADIFAQLEAIAIGELDVRLRYLEIIRSVSPGQAVEESNVVPIQKPVTQKIEYAIPGRNDNMATARAAAAVGTNRQYVADAEKIQAQIPFISWLLSKTRLQTQTGILAAHISADKDFPMTADVKTMLAYVKSNYTKEQKSVYSCMYMQYSRWRKGATPCN